MQEIEPLLPENGRREGPWRDHRIVVHCGILWRLRAGSPWRDLLERYGSRQTCFDLDPERKADLLATTVHWAFELEGIPPSATVRAIIPSVIELSTEIAEVNHAKVHQDYE